LKVWLSVGYFGLEAFRTAIDNALDFVELARRRIADDDRLEAIAPGELSITCFRRRVEGGEEEAAQVNEALLAAYEASGLGLVSSTRLDGRYAVRLCVLNPATGRQDVEKVLDFFATAPTGPSPDATRARTPHMMDVAGGWLGSTSA
jgi:aromatic-L-amino-acid decarboxylase